MAETKAKATFANTKPVTMTYVNLVTPERVKVNGKPIGDPVYSASFAFDNDSEDLASLKAAMADIARAKWPGRTDWTSEFQTPLSLGAKENEKRLKKTGKKDNEWMVGKTLLKASSGQDYPPNIGVIDEGGKVFENLRDNPLLLSRFKSKFYWGAGALFVVTLTAYDRVKEDAKDGIKAYLQGVLSTGTGAKIGGGLSLENRFGGVIGQFTQEDPTTGEVGDDDNGPF